ncbi:Delta(1)-pyrroline-2-carboxylate reductase [Roseibaca ekhonensis]|jgi:ornithine cyclodeaminase|uniref:Delta(1)-pyrroline-2-carboxylate reductase n=1 Tax=Roseinatronobacter ekhonensis TaxID=254356 RepID=A0A3B0MHC6_9RHOB|nr:ornithine cyclodeaminase [Roseibaca ekhonensis]SUZ30537.1 Delta(1)-pyrroline-2-carboxylate reductase [Roseibaca ekhonensis]
MTPTIISADIEPQLDWLELIAAFESGHRRPKAEIADSFLYRGTDTLLSRAAWVDGLGSLVKTATIYPDNSAQGLPNVNGAVALFSDTTGELAAMVDFHLVTKWKTAGDSLFAASKLARPDSQKITLVGAGAVSKSMHAAYSALFPDAEFTVWNRSPEAAQAMARALPRCTASDDLQAAVTQADIICTATMSKQPILRGEWLRAGQHIDLIGAFRSDMREADDTALRRAALFVDNVDTTLDHIGEMKIPLAQGVITRADIQSDFYGIARGEFARKSDDTITVCKNGGGAHLDLMTAAYILEKLYKIG